MQQRQQQREPGPSPILAFWRETVAENPVYRRELLQVTVASNLAEEKVIALREKRRAELAAWDALPVAQKLWRRLRPQLFVFGLTYLTLPWLLHWLSEGSGGLLGPLLALFLGTGTTAAGLLVGERERRTWNALLLSGLTPSQILGGKAAFLLKSVLVSLVTLLTVGLAAVARGVLPLTALPLVLFVLLSHSLLAVLAGLRISLWSVNLRLALRKASWQGLLLSLPAFLVGLAALLPFFGVGPRALLLIPMGYVILALGGASRLWKRLLSEFYAAPKDFSG